MFSKTMAQAKQAVLRHAGLLLVVSGPSGVGKGTLIAGVLARHPEVRVSVSCTTRAPRRGEVNGRDYHFVTLEEFQRLRDAGELLEWAQIHGDLYYGTPRRPVEEALARGEDMILEIDYQGARAVRTILGDRSVLVFVAPPTWGTLLERLQMRHTERPEEVAARLESAGREIANMGLYDYVVVNDDLQRATDELEAVLLAERCTARRFDWRTFRDRLLADAEAASSGGGQNAIA
ncbi:MAG: guanylate kinase [Armatimonadetes bacterium]|nr:guanylate kinase [Armatimonadota bacterium]